MRACLVGVPFASRELAEHAATLIAEHAYRQLHMQDAEINFAALCFRLSLLQSGDARGDEQDD